MKEVIETLDFTASERDVTVALTGDFPRALSVKAPVDGLRHVFSNIISNAIKYSHVGSTVRVGFSRENDTAVISVEDQGIGIPERDQRKIFVEYFRGSNAPAGEKGTGLGLYFTKRLVESFGGRVWFVSEEHKGSKFYIEVPLHKTI
ncbi:MAG: ATP-binding protein [Candidatus Vogelbacteria bacterium]|nr:ATP-binding protein [Candidatus Vogelbacteria bacterium]